MANNRYFQWLTGERRGDLVVFDKIVEEDNIIYVAFKDGSRINQDFIAELNERNITGKMMAEVESPNIIWTFRERITGSEKRIETDWESQVNYEVPSIEEIMEADAEGNVKPKLRKKAIDLIPPRLTHPSKFGQIRQSDTLQQLVMETNKNENISKAGQLEEPAKISSNDPVCIMLDKAKKVDTDVEIKLVITLPSKDLYNVIKESFSEGDKKTIEYIIENIDISKIKESLKIGITQLYEPEMFELKAIEDPIISDSILEDGIKKD
jgi:hypothetical protein